MRAPFSFWKAAGAIVNAIKFTGSQSFASGAYGGTTLGTARVRFRLDQIAATGFKIIAGSNPNTGTDGWLVYTDDDYAAGGATQLVVYAKVTGGLWKLLFRKYLTPSDVGRIFTIHIVCGGGAASVYLDGARVGVGALGAFNGAVAAPSILASTGFFNIGGTSTGANSSVVTMLDAAEGTTAISSADVLVDFASSVPAYAGQTHRWVAAPGITTTWADQVGSATLTAFGSPTAISFPGVYGKHLGALEIYGDSIAAGRREDNGIGDGWRRAVQQGSSAAGRSISLIGYAASAAATKDFDYWTSAVPGQALFTGGTGRLTTLAADLATNGPLDAATYLAYGINDIVVGGRTAAQLQTDVATACGLIAAARPGRPIFVQNILPVGSAGATAPQLAVIATYNSGFAAMITSLQATYPSVVGIDVTAAISNPNDTAQLFDGVHPTVGIGYPAMAAIIGPAVRAAMTSNPVATTGPQSLPFTGAWDKGAYVVGSWKGLPTSGISGARNTIQATVAAQPAVSSGDAAFNGTSTYLADGVGSANYVAASGGTVVCLFQATTVAAYVDGVHDAALISDNSGSLSLSVSANGVTLTNYDGAYKRAVKVAGTGALHLAIGRWDGTNLDLCLDGVWSAATACGACAPSGNIQLGTNFAIAQFFNGTERFTGLMSRPITNAEAAALRTWFQANRGLP